jgi:hypothetical protein
MNRYVNRYVFSFLILTLTLFNLSLFWGLRLHVESGQSFDDALYIHLANAIINNEWLGAYNNLTLSKMPGYPLWIAFNHYIGVPLLFTQQLLYVLAGLIFLVPFRKVIKSPTILIVLYSVYLFNPAIETRVMREGIYTALSVLVFAALAGVYVYRDKMLHLFLWSVFLGLSLSMLWLTREEGVWIVPSLIIIMCYTVFQLYQTYKFSGNFYKRFVFLALPFVILLTSILAISAINKIYYGNHTLTEINSKPFISAYGALSRVKHPQWKRYLPVPEDVRRKIYSVSPAFKEIEPFLEGAVGKRWVPLTCGFYPNTCPDIGGGWFMWALREAVSYSGYHQSATKAKEYYQRLATEVNSACENDFLNCLPPRETLISPYHPEYIMAGIKTFFAGVKRIISLPIPVYVYSQFAHSVGTEYGLKIFNEITHNPVSAIAEAKSNYDALTALDVTKLNISKRIEWIYRSLLPAFYVIVPVFMLCLFISLLNRKITFLLVVNMSILAGLTSRLIILTMIDISSFPTLFNWWAYLVPFYPLLLVFLVLAGVESFAVMQSFKKALAKEKDPD